MTPEAPEMDPNHIAGEAIEAAVRVAAAKGAALATARRVTLDLGDDGSITVAVTDAPKASAEGDAIPVSFDEIAAAIEADEAAEMPPPPPVAA